MGVPPNASTPISPPPISRLIWVIYNSIGLYEAHTNPMKPQTNRFCKELQMPYWREYRKWKFGE